MSLVPTPVAIELVPIGGIDGVFGREVVRRAGMAPGRGGRVGMTLTDADQVRLARRVARGNWLARPIGGRWRKSYGALVDRVGWRVLDLGGLETGREQTVEGNPPSEALLGALRETLDLPCELPIQTRNKWPRGVPIRVDLRATEWWPQSVYCDVNVDWSANKGASSGEERRWRGWVAFDPGLEGRVTVDLDISLDQELAWLRGQDGQWRRGVQRVEGSVSYEVVDSIDDAMTAVGGDEYDELILDVVEARWERDMLDFYGVDKLKGTALEGVAIGARAEMLQDGVVRGWYEVRCIGGGPGFSMSGWHDAGTGDWEEGGTWAVRLRTDETMALYVLDAAQYWRGEVELPLIEP
jgi:hypothetical protein